MNVECLPAPPGTITGATMRGMAASGIAPSLATKSHERTSEIPRVRARAKRASGEGRGGASPKRAQAAFNGLAASCWGQVNTPIETLANQKQGRRLAGTTMRSFLSAQSRRGWACLAWCALVSSLCLCRRQAYGLLRKPSPHSHAHAAYLTIPPHRKHAKQAPATLAAHKIHLFTPCCPM